KGPEKLRKVEPIKNEKGEVIGGNVDVRQIWYDSHIESDTAFIDPSQVMDVPWTITYTVDVLNRGRDDFSPFVMYNDGAVSPDMPMGHPHVGMDATFFPMEEGKRTVLKLKMAPGKYYSLTYTWGWRMHPPRVQVSENSLKKMGFLTDDLKPAIDKKALLTWETDVFGTEPSKNEETKHKAIDQIGDLAPEKRMWKALRQSQKDDENGDWVSVLRNMLEAKNAFRNWHLRTRLPREAKGDDLVLPPGIEIDKDSDDLTLLYVNNTIYAEFTTRDMIA